MKWGALKVFPILMSLRRMAACTNVTALELFNLIGSSNWSLHYMTPTTLTKEYKELSTLISIVYCAKRVHRWTLNSVPGLQFDPSHILATRIARKGVWACEIFARDISRSLLMSVFLIDTARTWWCKSRNLRIMIFYSTWCGLSIPK